MIMLALLLLGIAIIYYGKEIAMEDTISWEQTVDPTGSSTGRHRHLNHSQSVMELPFNGMPHRMLIRKL
jgi:hypothetical protein